MTSRASVADRRASAALRQKRASIINSPSDEGRADSRASSSQHGRKTSMTTTTTETKRDTLTRETLLKRTTIIPTRRAESVSQVRRSADVDRPASQGRPAVRREADEPASMLENLIDDYAESGC